MQTGIYCVINIFLAEQSLEIRVEREQGTRTWGSSSPLWQGRGEGTGLFSHAYP